MLNILPLKFAYDSVLSKSALHFMQILLVYNQTKYIRKNKQMTHNPPNLPFLSIVDFTELSILPFINRKM